MMRLTGFALGLVLLLALFHLLTLGLPQQITQKITGKLQENNLPVTIDSIRLSPHRGWVLHNVRLYSPVPDDLEPIFYAKKIYVQLWPDQWTQLFDTNWRVIAHSKQLNVSLGNEWNIGLNQNDAFRSIKNAQADIHISPEQIVMNSAELTWGGWRIIPSGKVERQPPAIKTTDSSGYEIVRNHALQAAQILNKIKFDSPPSLNIVFEIQPGHPEKNHVKTTLSTGGFEWNNQRYTEAYSLLRVDSDSLSLDAAKVRQSENRQLILSGALKPKKQTGRISVQNTLTSDHFMHLIPASIQKALTQHKLHFPGEASFDLSVLPATSKEAGKRLEIAVHNAPVVYKGIKLDPLRFELTHTGKQLSITNMEAKANGGPLSGSFDINLDSKAWKTALSGQCGAKAIDVLSLGYLHGLIERFRFPNDSPNVSVQLSHEGIAGTLQIDGKVSGENSLCAGIPLDLVQTEFSYSNKLLVLNNFQANQAEKQFSGNIGIDFDQSLVRFDASSSFSPSQIEQVLFPDQTTFIDWFAFTDPVSISANGQVDYSGGTNHAFKGVLTARKVDAAGIQVNRFKSSIQGEASRLVFTNTSMKAFGGTIEGAAEFDLALHNKRSPYRVDIDATRLDFSQVLNQFSTNKNIMAKGQLSTAFAFTADMDRGFWESANGQGAIEIEKGQLHDLPILSGFSRIIRTTLPGFSLFSITTLYADYKLQNGFLQTDKLQLGGTVLSANARGKYSPKTGLDFTVRAEPLRQTRDTKKWYHLHLWLADTLKQGTAPLFDLLEFRLEGTLKKPTWRMKALPKEVYEILRREPSEVEK